MLTKPYSALLVLILLIAFPIFAHLDGAPILLWDEARLATSALEMSHNHDWLIPRVHGIPDMWSTKPPMMIWLQAILIKLMGASELAVRLPSALAALATCLLLFFLFAKKLKEPLAGVICAVILITSQGFVVIHGARTGDYDALLTCCMAGYAVAFFLYMEEPKRKYLFATFLLLIMAGLTKGIEGLIFLPGLPIYAVYKRKLFSTLRKWNFYLGCFAFLFFVTGYYLLREHYNQGYIAAVKINELGGRFTTVIESHSGDGLYYYNLLVNDQFRYWYLFVIPGIITGIISRDKLIKDITVLSTLLAFIYFFVISAAKTKLDWYTMPMIPFLSILSGVFLFSVCKLLAGFEGCKPYLRYNPLPFIFVFLVFFSPYQAIVSYALSNADDPYNFRKDFKNFLKEALHHDRNIDGCAILYEGFDNDINWYTEAMKYEHIQVSTVRPEQVAPMCKLIVALPEGQKIIENKYYTQKLDTFKTVIVYQLKGLKAAVN